MIRIFVVHMCIGFIFQHFGQKVVEIISTVLKSCLSKVSSLFLDPKKTRINKKDTRPALDCGFMYCLPVMQCNIKLTSGCHVYTYFRRVLQSPSSVFWSVCVVICPQIQGQESWYFCGSSSTRRWWVHHC